MLSSYINAEDSDEITACLMSSSIYVYIVLYWFHVMTSRFLLLMCMKLLCFRMKRMCCYVLRVCLASKTLLATSLAILLAVVDGVSAMVAAVVLFPVSPLAAFIQILFCFMSCQLGVVIKV